MEIFHNLSAWIVYIINTFGYLGVAAIVFAESGLLLGIFLPGDSLIFIAGLIASKGHLNIVELIIFICISAMLGDNAGYFIGIKMGRSAFERHNSFIFNKKNLERTEEFFRKYGRRTFLMQRFVPIVRVFAPFLAGVAEMRYGEFFIYDMAGSLMWGISITVLGYYLGTMIPDIDTYLLPIIAAIVIISFIPAMAAYVKKKRAAARKRSENLV